eukprot:1002315-Alexandrium_andersonii.AAC.1
MPVGHVKGLKKVQRSGYGHFLLLGGKFKTTRSFIPRILRSDSWDARKEALRGPRGTPPLDPFEPQLSPGSVERAQD